MWGVVATLLLALIASVFTPLQSANAAALGVHYASVSASDAKLVIDVPSLTVGGVTADEVWVSYLGSNAGTIEKSQVAMLWNDGNYLVVPVTGLTSETLESFSLSAYTAAGDLVAGPTPISFTTLAATVDVRAQADDLAASLASAASFPEVHYVKLGEITNKALNRRWFYMNLMDKYAFRVADVQVARVRSGKTYWVTITTAVLSDYAIGKASTRATIPTGAKLRIVIDDVVVKTFTH